MLQYDVKAISRKFFGHEVFSAERSLNQPKARCVCIRSINQSNRSISVLLLFLFRSSVFISRSYENRSMYISLVTSRQGSAMSMLHYVLTMVFMVSCGRNTVDHIFTEHLFPRLGTFAFPILEYFVISNQNNALCLE